MNNKRLFSVPCSQSPGTSHISAASLATSHVSAAPPATSNVSAGCKFDYVSLFELTSFTFRFEKSNGFVSVGVLM